MGGGGCVNTGHPYALWTPLEVMGHKRRSELRLYLGDLWERLGEERGNEFFYYLSKASS